MSTSLSREAIEAAGAVYGAILADPESRGRLLAARERRAAAASAAADAAADPGEEADE